VIIALRRRGARFVIIAPTKWFRAVKCPKQQLGWRNDHATADAVIMRPPAQ